MSAATFPATRRADFRAMGSTIELLGVGVDERVFTAGMALARDLAERWEQRFNRFRPDSELSRLNRAGSPVEVSSELFEMIECAFSAYRRTGGKFDPTILPGLVHAGYDRDFAEVRGVPPRSRPDEPVPAPGMEEIRLEPDALVVALPPGVMLDFGGIAKGAFVDRLALSLLAWPGGCVDAGGDLRIWGEPPNGDAWQIAIEHPCDHARDIATATIRDGRAAAIATSATDRKRWRTAIGIAHHLIDPASGRPLAERAVACTAFAATTIDAEIATKATLVAIAHGESPDPLDTAAMLVTDHNGNAQVIAGQASDAVDIVRFAP